MNSTFAKSMKINFISSENKANKHEKRSMKSRLKGRGWLSELVYCVGMKLHFHYFRLRIGFCIADKIELSLSLSLSLQSNSFSLWACSNNYKCASILSPPLCGESNDTRGNNISKGERGGKQGKVLQFMQIKWVLNFSLCKRTKLCKAGKQIANK